MDQTRILIVDDEPSIVKMLQMVLRKEGFNRIYTASSCKEALSEIAAHGADIVLLDVMLPDGTGFDLCPQIRSYGSPHILFLTAKASDLDVLTGFAMGGDDYVTKPFNPLEIAARIKARLRRGGIGATVSAEQPVIQRAWDFGRFKVDESAGELTVLGEPVPCPAQVFQLLLYFCKHPGVVFSKSQLYEAVWGIDGMGEDNTVMVHIRRIRERIEEDPSNPQYLLTVRGLGYKLVKEKAR
ncbi:response regulator transcription factor [Paenibacillus sp. FSL W7-1279]|uniref:response regulator transcription factor n=1 Tax=Paenibacillus TaxID=44249 RepID=UPI00188C0812|nr:MULTISPECIES: response regulator transcription factor [Paenibacillus]MBX4152090.1 response regulator transcription factor [Paenibacillus lautus]